MMMYEYDVKIVKVIDGDTVDVDIDLGFGVWIHKERVRLHGIDTPESRTSDATEKVFGLKAKAFLEKWVTAGDVTLRTKTYDAKGKFGRILGELWYAREHNINQKMIDEHHAVAYHGQSKDDIQEQHLKNREILLEKDPVR
jgi:micrococcal nuclease